MRFIRFIIGSVIALMLVLSAYADYQRDSQETGEIIVVTDSKHPVYNAPPNAQHIRLDTPQQLLEGFSTEFPNDLNQAASIAAERLRERGENFQLTMQSAVQGVVDAWGLQVQKIPAVILNQQYVVYGEPDVRLALEQIKSYLKTRSLERPIFEDVNSGASGGNGVNGTGAQHE